MITSSGEQSRAARRGDSMSSDGNTRQIGGGLLASEACASDLQFCPHGGLHGAPEVSLASQTLLHRRLTVAAWVLSFGFALFFVWHQIDPDAAAVFSRHPWLTGCRLGLIVLYLGLASLLSWAPSVCYRRLRVFEGLLFGSAAIFFIVANVVAAVSLHELKGDAGAKVFLPTIAIPWLILIQVYGLFIPNTWRRATLGILLFAAGPAIVLTSISLVAPNVFSAFDRSMVVTVLLWMVVPSAAAIYGSHRIECMSRDLKQAEQLGSYSLKKKLGAGGMGEVYLAEHSLLKRPAAIKLIKPSQANDPRVIARFESEVRTTAGLTHPNTVEIYDFGITEDGTFFYVMEFLPGMDLQDLVDWHGPVNPARAIYLARQVCGALREAHGQGIIHRDIKPGNIFAAERGGEYDIAKLLDFGLVRTMDGDADSIRLTQQGALVGSPAYTSPENVSGEEEPDARGDIYSLGATLYFLLTGRPVFEGKQPIKVLFAHVSEQPVPPRQVNMDIPADLEAVILKCLAKNPSERYQSVMELDDALAACQAARQWDPVRARTWWATRDRTAPAEHPRDDVEATIVTPAAVSAMVTPPAVAAPVPR